MKTRIILGPVILAGLGYAAYWSMRLAYADHLARNEQARDLAQAARIAPLNAAYWLRWAELASAEGETAPGALNRAAQLSSHEAEVWIRLGIDAESRGDYRTAERFLLRSTTVDHTYVPRWTLANYYVRRNDPQNFWPWVKSALEWSYQDATPLFQLCWMMTQDASEILSRGIPERRPILRQYLAFLLANDYLDAAIPIAQRLEIEATEEDRASLLGYTNRMLRSAKWDEAISAWNVLCARRLLGYPRLDATRAAALTNGSFAADPLNSGFDWRVSRLPGISVMRMSDPALRFTFSGKQPQKGELLTQYLPVASPSEYRLRFHFQAPASPDTGLKWKAYDAEDGSELAAAPRSLASASDWAAGDFSFPTRPTTKVVRLALTFQRTPGTTRIEGALWLRDLVLEPAP